MAEGDDEHPRNRQKITNSDDSDVDEPVKLDLGIDLSRKFDRNVKIEDEFGASASNVSDLPRREDNPFSFKHFLQSDLSNYHSQGARPKVYCDGRPISSISDLDMHNMTESKQTRIVPEFTSGLPDFVQDHLVVEQSYYNKDSYIDPSNLPDFAPSRSSVNINRLNLDSSRNVDRRSQGNSNVPIPLDLPIRPQADFPLDLPISEAQASCSRSCPTASEVAVSKSLPDFLADGAARTQADDDVSMQSPERDTDRLRHELDLTRRQLAEQTRRGDILHRELEIARNKEHEYAQNLAKALEHAEDNLERSNRRAASAEGTVLKLRQDIKTLTSEVNLLKRQNMDLRSEEGAAGGPCYALPDEIQRQRIAQDLRNAANTAEHSLRQLLMGVDNLRIMASTIESVNHVEETRETFVDFDDDTGHAL